MLEISFSKDALKALRKVQPAQQNRIMVALGRLAENPTRTDMDVKKLVGLDCCRLRVGEYRVIYTASGIVLMVEKIAPRGSAYKA